MVIILRLWVQFPCALQEMNGLSTDESHVHNNFTFPNNMNRIKITLVFFTLTLTVTAQTHKFAEDVSSASGLPVIYIETENSVAVTSKEDWTNMTSFVLSDPNHPENDMNRVGSYNGNNYHQIRGRGNTTWDYPKKPYRIRFRDETSVFGQLAHRNWILLAEYRDPTFLVNTVAFELGKNILQLPYTNTYQYVHLYFNGRYDGVYLFTEHRQATPEGTEPGPGRVDIDPVKGWLTEMSLWFDAEADPKFRTRNYDLPIVIKSPEFSPADISNPAYHFVRNDWNELCDIMASPEFPENGYRDLINMNTIVDYILANDIVFNGELGHPNSVFTYKDRNGKIGMGPLWDFDAAYGYAGGHTFFTDYPYPGWGWGQTRILPKHPFFQRFFEDPVFLLKYMERWNEKKQEVIDMTEFIDATGKKIRDAVAEDTQRWNVSGGYWSDYDSNHARQTGYMIDWWNRRTAWIDNELKKVNVLPASRNFSISTHDDSERQPQTFTLIAYGEINNLNARFQNGASSVVEISGIKTDASGNGGYLVTISVKPKDALPKGIYSDQLILSGENQGNTFRLETSVSVNLSYAIVSDDAHLKSMAVSVGKLQPAFTPNVTEYTVNVASNITAITIIGIANHKGANVTGNVNNKTLNDGENVVEITVIAENDTTQKIYTVTVLRGDNVTGAEEFFVSEMNVYPNPFINEVRIIGADGYTLQALTVSGAIVYTQKITYPDETINMERLPAGMYIFRMIKDGKVKTLKITKLK